MAVTENWQSQKMTITAEGRSLVAIYDCTWDDWNENFDDLPVIGDAWPDDDELFCSDIRTDVINNTNAKVTCTYSTAGLEQRQGRPDQVGSWHDMLDVSLVETTEDKYYDRTATAWKSWTTVWEDNDGTEDNRPPLTRFEASSTFTLTSYGSSVYLSRILNRIGNVNSVDFLTTLYSKLGSVQTRIDDDVSSFEDTGRWLFVGCTMTRSSATCMRYDWRFLYRGGLTDWNHEMKADGSGTIATNIYSTYDFFDLFDGMDYIDTETRLGYNQ